jgi:hypothetical protein
MQAYHMGGSGNPSGLHAWIPCNQCANRHVLLLRLYCPAGLIMQFRFFLRNDFGLLLLVFWLFTLALSSFSYFLSTFMSCSQSATYTGFAVFLVSSRCGLHCRACCENDVVDVTPLFLLDSRQRTQALQCSW